MFKPSRTRQSVRNGALKPRQSETGSPLLRSFVLTNGKSQPRDPVDQSKGNQRMKKQYPFRLPSTPPGVRREVKKMTVPEHLTQLKSTPYGGKVVDEESLLVTRSNGCGRFSVTMKVVDKNTSTNNEIEFKEQGIDLLKRLSNFLKMTPPNGKPVVVIPCGHQLVVTHITRLSYK